jgi:hypothetical protein
LVAEISASIPRPAGDTAAPARGSLLSCGAVATLAVLFAFAWQFLTVTRNYHGDWTALYCIGEDSRVPASLEGMYRFPASRGFDGQMYLIIALDPLFQHDTANYVDEPALRYRRILLPALAYAAGLGNPRAIVYTYILVNLVFLFLGVWWMSQYAVLCSRHAAWGWLFLAVPCVLISLDRQTVDMALTALTMGTLYAWQARRLKMLFLLLPLVCLVRETGVLIAGGFLLAFLLRRQWRCAGYALLSTAPFVAWTWVVGMRFAPSLREWFATDAYAWTAKTLLHPPALPFSQTVQLLVRSFDWLALLGFLIGTALTFRAAVRTRWIAGPVLAGGLIATLCVYLFSLPEWTHVYDFGRLSSPMAVLIMADRSSSRFGWLPSTLMTLRVLVQLAPQAMGIAGLHF